MGKFIPVHDRSCSNLQRNACFAGKIKFNPSIIYLNKTAYVSCNIISFSITNFNSIPECLLFIQFAAVQRAAEKWHSGVQDGLKNALWSCTALWHFQVFDFIARRRSIHRSTWDLLIFICTIYVAALVPYQSVFKDSDYVLQKYAHSLINLSSFL